jgi:hypothetical protein
VGWYRCILYVAFVAETTKLSVETQISPLNIHVMVLGHVILETPRFLEAHPQYVKTSGLEDVVRLVRSMAIVRTRPACVHAYSRNVFPMHGLQIDSRSLRYVLFRRCSISLWCSSRTCALVGTLRNGSPNSMNPWGRLMHMGEFHGVRVGKSATSQSMTNPAAAPPRAALTMERIHR